MGDDSEDHPAVFDEQRRADLEIEEAYDMMFGVGAFRWAEEQALRRLRSAQAAAVAEAERQLRGAGGGGS